jgi:uncharacterized protein (TIGR01777 family)
VPAFGWDPEKEEPPPAALSGIDAVVHLAGEPVLQGRWNEQKKRRIRDSRVLGTRRLVDGMARLSQKPRVLVSASAVGYYGDRGADIVMEGASPADDFLAQVCVDWEREAERAGALGIRVVCARIGVLLSTGGGALAQMLPLFRIGAGGTIGRGRQWMPWIHVGDAADLLLYAAKEESISGAMNVVAPEPVTNAEFCRTLAGALRRPAMFPVPPALLRLAFGEVSQVMTASLRAVPRVALDHGFSFTFPRLESALAHLLERPSRDP